MVDFIVKVVRYVKTFTKIHFNNGIFQIHRCVERIKFPYTYNKIAKSENSIVVDIEKSVQLMSSFRPDNGSLCTLRFDPKECKKGVLTIIIPVYNVESYIEECLNSILTQDTEYDYRIHIIDDGSTDNTLKMVNQYASKYSCVIISTQKNSSQAVARNNALNSCDSEWVMMVDGDDILPQGAIQTLMEIAINADCDVVEGAVQAFYGGWVINNPKKIKHKLFNSENFNIQQFALTSKGYSCGKIYRRSLWNNVRYPERYIFEDIITKYVICRKAKRYARTNQVVYGYRYRNDSSSHSGDYRKLDCLWVMDKVQKIRSDNYIPNDSINHILMMNHFGMLTPLMVSNLGAEYQQAAITIAREYLIKWDVKRSCLPYFFRKSYDAVMALNVNAWMLTFRTIAEYKFVTRYREIN